MLLFVFIWVMIILWLKDNKFLLMFVRSLVLLFVMWWVIGCWIILSLSWGSCFLRIWWLRLRGIWMRRLLGGVELKGCMCLLGGLWMLFWVSFMGFGIWKLKVLGFGGKGWRCGRGWVMRMLLSLWLLWWWIGRWWGWRDVSLIEIDVNGLEMVVNIEDSFWWL